MHMPTNLTAAVTGVYRWDRSVLVAVRAHHTHQRDVPGGSRMPTVLACGIVSASAGVLDLQGSRVGWVGGRCGWAGIGKSEYDRRRADEIDMPHLIWTKDALKQLVYRP
jgi:hypothetical protein